jgi:nickel superoxide dismutase
MKNIVIFLSKLIPAGKTAYAHCDIPCGIYDPYVAQRAAHTIIRMTQFLGEIKRDNETKAEHDIARVTHVKEEHSDLLEEELTTLQNDYFKEEHYKEYPKLQEFFANANKLGAKARQNIDIETAKELLEAVMQIAEVFYKTKGLVPFRTKSPYPTELEVVLHK